MKTISILGCGWLGLPLAEFLREKGYGVKGSTASLEKLDTIKEKGIDAYYINLTPGINSDYNPDFFDSDILIINFPPQRRDDVVKYHKQQFESLINELKKSNVRNIIFISSTSVYPEVNRVVTEDDILEPSKESGKALLAVENMLMDCSDFKTTVLRFAGLIGYDRMPGRFLSGKRGIRNGNSPVNLIHRDDCIEIIVLIIDKNLWGEIFNGCADKHPIRKDYYTEQAKIAGLEPPDFSNSGGNKFKIVSNSKLKQSLKYNFKYSDPSTITENSS